MAHEFTGKKVEGMEREGAEGCKPACPGVITGQTVPGSVQVPSGQSRVGLSPAIDRGNSAGWAGRHRRGILPVTPGETDSPNPRSSSPGMP